MAANRRGTCPICGGRLRVSGGYCKSCHAAYMREFRAVEHRRKRRLERRLARLEQMIADGALVDAAPRVR